MMAFTEVCIPRQSARGLRDVATVLTGVDYNLVQQTRVNGLSKVEGEALLTRFGIVETGNFDYQTKDIVALVARVLVDGTALDVYVTRLFTSPMTAGLMLVSSSWTCLRPRTSSRAPTARRWRSTSACWPAGGDSCWPASASSCPPH